MYTYITSKLLNPAFYRTPTPIHIIYNDENKQDKNTINILYYYYRLVLYLSKWTKNLKGYW